MGLGVEGRFAQLRERRREKKKTMNEGKRKAKGVEKPRGRGVVRRKDAEEMVIVTPIT